MLSLFLTLSLGNFGILASAMEEVEPLLGLRILPLGGVPFPALMPGVTLPI